LLFFYLLSKFVIEPTCYARKVLNYNNYQLITFEEGESHKRRDLILYLK